METSLHRQLKARYATEGARQEVSVDGFRIDVVRGDELVEIQHGSLAAIRDKIRQLVRKHAVLIVKPIVVRKQIVRLAAKDGDVVSRRLSPKQGSVLDLFDELVYFTRVFPHRNLTLEVPLVNIEEWRYPGHGRRRRWRTNDHQVADQKLVSVGDVFQFVEAADLLTLLPTKLPQPFHSGDLAAKLNVRRWIAQRIVYCLRKTGAVDEVGKQKNARLYATPRYRRSA